jgi:CPA2 family monovalent cation:H+ antiporter-2
MQTVTFLQDLAVVMIVAGLVTVVFHRFKQPVVLGYIVAGAIIGPHTPPFPLIRDEETIKTLAELGVILLLFSLGLEFNLRKLRRVGGTALIAASLEIVLMLGVGYHTGRWFGWNSMDSLFLGAMISISSTTIIVRTLAELGKSKERFAELILGILIVQDMLAIVMIALLSGIAMTGSFSVSDVGATVGKLAIFLSAALVIGLIAVPPLLRYVARFRSDEMLLVTVLGLCFGSALLAVKLGYSVALGAFIIGAVIAEAREIGRVAVLTEPIRDMFSAIFFVSIGLLIDPKMLAIYWLPILVITFAVVAGQIFCGALGTFVSGHNSRTAMRVGMGLAQIGEFSFIIASLGVTLNVTSNFLYPIAVAVSVITTLLTPYLLKNTDRLVNWFDRVAPRALLAYLDVYTRWVGQFGASRERSMAAKLTRRWLWQVALNAALIGAVFIAAAFVSERSPQWVRNLGLTGGRLRPALWFAAMALSLPSFIATFRKLQALGMLTAEAKVTQAAAGERTSAIRGVVAQMIPFTGMILLGLYVLVLSSALLPSWQTLLTLLLLLGIMTGLFWRSFIKIYARAQVALKETLAEPPVSRTEEPARPLSSLLREAHLEAVAIKPASLAAGKLIRELQLRTRTGGSIVAIERAGTSIVNPGPDEELQPSDRVLLLGSRSQLDQARAVLDAELTSESTHEFDL